ncbi:DUF1801 domain-containing protein [Lederbergia wuyishanensis]|uniref:YdhG-like domain-containing protein n=1 Tax=Lederbergia wuyishanensis TaxID=1347903 RepID=A0ABU0D813_9BACI|nr:DUF1801 domain-containing protein [Lederbergia wuyishanensis]MCJ8009322.1 DUF1801 domain-containing protein [Lederbergia wuyishanensis]MDQ0344544.1 hypothetical protein [Lederbergia wuyishanensis]
MTNKKTNRISGSEQVAEFMINLKHPLKKEIDEVRIIILSANEQITEHIKWNAPSFCYKNEDRVTFNLHGKGFFRLVFHCGAKAKENHLERSLVDDTTELLEWVSSDRAIVKFTDMNDVKEKKDKLVEAVNKWIDATF